jgi:hypothetical protein
MQKSTEWRNGFARAALEEVRAFFEGDSPAVIHDHVNWATDPQKLNYRFENGQVRITRWFPSWFSKC